MTPIEIVQKYQSKMTADEIIKWNNLIRSDAPYKKLKGFANKIAHKYTGKRI